MLNGASGWARAIYKTAHDWILILKRYLRRSENGSHGTCFHGYYCDASWRFISHPHPIHPLVSFLHYACTDDFALYFFFFLIVYFYRPWSTKFYAYRLAWLSGNMGRKPMIRRKGKRLKERGNKGINNNLIERLWFRRNVGQRKQILQPKLKRSEEARDRALTIGHFFPQKRNKE